MKSFTRNNHTFLKLILLIGVFNFAVNIGHAQDNILTLKDSIDYTENNVILKGKPYSIYHSMCYNEAGVIDEEFCHTLKITFPDRKAIQEGESLFFKFDSLLMQGTYGIFSVWNWSDENNNMEGDIEVLKWNKRRVVLKLNLLVHDERRERFVRYNGYRTFKRGKAW